MYTILAPLMLLACSPEKGPENKPDDGGNTQPAVVELTGISLTEHEITLEKGGNQVLEVAFTPENATDKTLIWESSKPFVATVSDGMVQGVAPGTAEITVKSGSLSDKCQVTVVSSATSIVLDQTELTLALGETATLKATVLPEDSTDEVEWSSTDEGVATVENGVVKALAPGETVITAKTMDGSDIEDQCTVHVKEHWVDLGLPSGLKWAICNLGAFNVADCGDYFAWGEVAPKDDYTWSTYKWCANGNASALTKYCGSTTYGSVDNISILQRGEGDEETMDDAARAILGGSARMPTRQDFQELIDNCDRSWCSVDNSEGCMFTSRANPNNWIFLPAAGYKKGTSIIDDGWKGVYWSSTAHPFEYNSAFCFYSIDNNNYVNVTSDQRAFGYLIRPVREK